MAIIIPAAETRGPLAAPIQSCKGIVTPYFNAVAILFSLYAALLSSDAWEKDVHARRVVSDEANAAQLIAHTEIGPSISAPRSTMIAAVRAKPSRPLPSW